MRRPIRFAAVLTASFIVGACVDVPSAPVAVTEVRERGSIVAGTCTTVQELNTLAKQVFGPGTPNASSALGKIKTLDQAVKKRQLDQAAKHAHDLVDFTLKKHQADQTPAPDAVVTAFVNKVYCYAGIDIGLNDPSNSHLIFPSDLPQVKYAVDIQSAIRFDANPVSEPTLIEFQQLPTIYPPGGGPLDTKLDQYPGFVLITKSSETDAPLTKPAVVGICASGVIPQEVRDRLRLGHGLETGTEITPAADAGFLDCENATGVAPVGSAGVRLLRGLADFVLPAKLHARVFQAARGGGVGGTVTEFSPFAPVDPVLRAGGGVGGTVTEFIRMPMLVDPFSANSVAPVESCANGITGEAGLPVAEVCRPFVRITTRLGTLFSGVPVTWNATLGGGLVANSASSACGSFAATIVGATDLFGRSAVCWKLGVIGANQVTAVPGIGGDALAGVTFSPASVTFDAVARAPERLGVPTDLVKVQGEGQTAPAGAAAPVAPRVRVTDPYGNPVAGVRVHFVALEGSGSVTPASVLSDASGLATATWTLGAGHNRLKVYINAVVFTFVYFDATGTTP